jgi:hypothetical protein
MSDDFTLQNLLDDLHKLEINTIEKASMTAQKMPAPLLAFFEIIDGYESYISWNVNKKSFNYASVKSTRKVEDPNYGLKQRLENLINESEVAFDALKYASTGEEQTKRMIVGRIGRSCESLLGMLTNRPANAPGRDKSGPIDREFLGKTAADLRRMDAADVEKAWRLSSTDRAFLRKMWEISTEKVLIQTVVQIEGDVITRISPLVLQEENNHLMQIHRNAIETSLEMWGVLVGVAERLVGGIGKALGQAIGLGR